MKDPEPTKSVPAQSKNVAGDLVIPGQVIYLRLVLNPSHCDILNPLILTNKARILNSQNLSLNSEFLHGSLQKSRLT